MALLDLHIHTSCSDGTMSPAELVRYASEEGFALISITDHDTIDGVAEGQQAAAALGIRVISGLEISAEFSPGTMHILGYNFNIDDSNLNQTLQELQQYRRDRNPKIISRLQEQGYQVTYQEVESIAGGGQVGRPHFAKLLISKGYFESTQEVFDKMLAKGQPAYMPKKRLSSAQAIKLISTAGGLPVLAHPKSLKLSELALAALVGELKATGLGGLEVYHSSHSAADIAFYQKLSTEHDLIATGGSDFHGESKPSVTLGLGVALTCAQFDQVFAPVK